MTNQRVLRDYQQTGVDFLAENYCAMLGDEPGLGKSIQALRALKQRFGDAPLDRTVLIVCPAIARVSWESEAKAEGFTTKIVDTKFSPIHVNAADIWIVSWDTLGLKANQTLRGHLRGIPWAVIIADEAHYAKSHAANRTKAFYGRRMDMAGGLVENASNVWLLSGTFAPNNASELWPHFRALWPDMLKDLNALDRLTFEDKFCVVRETTYGRSIMGSKNLHVLKAAMDKREIMLRRKKADVLKDLPPLDFVDEFIPPGLIDMPVLNGVPLPQDDDDDLIDYLEQNAPHLATMRRALGVAKAFPTIGWASSMLENGMKKLILFAVHREVIDLLQKGLIEFKPVVITGDTPHAKRIEAVNQFQNDPDTRVFIGNIQAAGTAITLTAAKDVAIVEPSWVPSDNYQAACRAHRIGQHDGVLCRFLSVPGTLDDRISSVFRRKAKQISELFE